MERICPYCMHHLKEDGSCPRCGSKAAGYRPASHHLPPGSILKGRYVVGRVLGEGGFGITYLGMDANLERRVAVKEYFPTCLVSRETSLSLSVTCYTQNYQDAYEKGRSQFLKEARTMARLENIPEIVQVLDHFQDNNTAYIVMEFLEGETLKDRTARLGRIPSGELLELLRPVMRAMEAMHQAGIIHRDISPDNLMCLPGGKVKLMDFGCAKEIQGQPTQTVTLKHGFAPREQYVGRGQGAWTDVYALCATIYYCLTGKVPPRSVERQDGDQDALTPPTQLGAELTEQQERALVKGLAVRAQNRWQSMAQLYGALYGVTLEGQPWRDREERSEDAGHTEFFHQQKEKTDSDGVAAGEAASGNAQRYGRKFSRRMIAATTAVICAGITLAVALPLMGSQRAAVPAGAEQQGGNQVISQTAGQTDTPEEVPGDSLAMPQQEEILSDAAESSESEPSQPEQNVPPPTSNNQPMPQEPAPAKPPQQAEPKPAAQPTQAELTAQAENYAANGQYTQAADTYRQMHTLGYLSGGELGEQLCSLGNDAQEDREYEIAAQLYQQAADLGNALGKRLLSVCYEFGTGVPQSHEKAFQLNLELAQENYGASVYYDVAAAYTDGVGTARDPEQAIYWWNRYLDTDDPKDTTRAKIQDKIAALEAER